MSANVEEQMRRALSGTRWSRHRVSARLRDGAGSVSTESRLAGIPLTVSAIRPYGRHDARCPTPGNRAGCLTGLSPTFGSRILPPARSVCRAFATHN
jgi:hypothetical protein